MVARFYFPEFELKPNPAWQKREASRMKATASLSLHVLKNLMRKRINQRMQVSTLREEQDETYFHPYYQWLEENCSHGGCWKLIAVSNSCEGWFDRAEYAMFAIVRYVLELSDDRDAMMFRMTFPDIEMRIED